MSPSPILWAAQIFDFEPDPIHILKFSSQFVYVRKITYDNGLHPHNSGAGDNQAWDTLTWFAALIAMASYLNKYGFIKWFSDNVVNLVGGLGLSWQSSFGVVVLLYFYSHYLFASGAAHIGAMYTAFLSVATACGTPGMLAAIALGQLSNVMGCLSTYGIGSAPPYFGAGYVPQSKWYQLGFIMSIFYLAVWGFAGGAWWKVIGLW